MAVKNTYLKMIPNLTVREALRKLFNSGSSLTNDIVGDVTGDVTGNLTGAVTGAVTSDVLEASASGAGAIGTGGLCRAYVRSDNGEIITTIVVDITGLGCKGGNADDVIGVVSAAPDAYLYEMTTAKNGIIYKVTMDCLELPAGSGSATLDINLTMNALGTLGYDEACSNDYLFNTGTMAAGQRLENITPSFATTDFIYLTEGDAAATDGVYTAGQFVITLHGRAILA